MSEEASVERAVGEVADLLWEDAYHVSVNRWQVVGVSSVPAGTQRDVGGAGQGSRRGQCVFCAQSVSRQCLPNTPGSSEGEQGSKPRVFVRHTTRRGAPSQPCYPSGAPARARACSCVCPLQSGAALLHVVV